MQQADLPGVASVGIRFDYRFFMRCIVLIVAGMLLTGCASRAKTLTRVVAEPDAKLANYGYAPTSASALAFDPRSWRVR